MGFEAECLATWRISTLLGFLWQHSHGGLSTGSFTDEQFQQYDRIIKENYFHIAGSVAYSFPRVDVFGSWIEYVSGTDTHASRTISGGVSWPFERRAGPEHSVPQPHTVGHPHPGYAPQSGANTCI